MEVNLTGVHHSVSRGVPGGNAARGSIASSHVKLSLAAGLRLGAIVYALLLLRDALAGTFRLAEQIVQGRHRTTAMSVHCSIVSGSSSRGCGSGSVDMGSRVNINNNKNGQTVVSVLQSDDWRWSCCCCWCARSPWGVIPVSLGVWVAANNGACMARVGCSRRDEKTRKRSDGRAEVNCNYCILIILIIDWIRKGEPVTSLVAEHFADHYRLRLVKVIIGKVVEWRRDCLLGNVARGRIVVIQTNSLFLGIMMIVKLSKGISINQRYSKSTSSTVAGTNKYTSNYNNLCYER